MGDTREASISLSPGDRVGPYEVIASIGAGGMGEVYRAHDDRLHRDVALKIVSPRFALDPARQARFAGEAPHQTRRPYGAASPWQCSIGPRFARALTCRVTRLDSLERDSGHQVVGDIEHD